MGSEFSTLRKFDKNLLLMDMPIQQNFSVGICRDTSILLEFFDAPAPVSP